MLYDHLESLIEDIEYNLVPFLTKMSFEKCSEIRHTIELKEGEKYRIHIKKISR